MITIALCVACGVGGFILGLEAERAGRPEIKLAVTKAPCFPGWNTEGGGCLPPSNNTVIAHNPGLALMREPIRATVPISFEECNARGGVAVGLLSGSETVGRSCHNHKDGTITPIAEAGDMAPDQCIAPARYENGCCVTDTGGICSTNWKFISK